MFQVIGWSQTRELFLAFRQAARGVLHHRESFRQDLVELGPLLGQLGSWPAPLSMRGLRAQVVVRERLELLVQLVDATDRRQHALDLALILRAEYFL